MVCREPELPPSEGFVLEQEELDLWVMDIPFETSEILNDQFTNIFDHLVIYKETLRRIGKGYEDFAINLEFSLPYSACEFAFVSYQSSVGVSVSDWNHF